MAAARDLLPSTEDPPTGSARRLLVLLLLSAVLLAGCQDRAATPGPSPSTAAPGPSTAAPVSLTFQVYGDKAVTTAYRRIARAFNEDHPGITVTLTRASDAATAAEEVVSHPHRRPDLFLLDEQYLARIVTADAVVPLDQRLEDRGLQFGDDFQRSALTALSADSQLKCMPTEMSPLVVYYNRDLVPRRFLRRSGFTFPQPSGTWRWEDFEAAARATAGLDRLGPIKGTYLPPSSDLLAAFVRSAGGDVVDDGLDPSRLTLSSDEGISTVAALAALARDPVVSLTAADLARRDAVGWFTSGRLGLLIGTRADLPRLRAAAGLHFDVVPLPSFGKSRSVSQVKGLCINSGSAAVEAAADFVAFAVGPRASRIAAASEEIVPSRLDALTSSAFEQPGEPPLHSEAFLDSSQRSDPLPYSVDWPQAADAIEATLREIYAPSGPGLERGLRRRLERLDNSSTALFAPAPTASPSQADG